MASLAGPGSADPLVKDIRRSGLVTLLVLHYVAGAPCYGNQLMERIASLTSGALSVNPNTMYPLLRTLEGNGLLAGKWEFPGRRGRRFYKITRAGLAERRRLVVALAPSLDAVAGTIDLLRRELLDR
jgi:DNA-binding PadR family transcriptional regulator